MQTDSFGNKGYYRDTDTNEVCSPLADGSYSSDCQFSIDVMGRQTGSGLGTIPNFEADPVRTDTQPMWVHYDLQNKCDATDIDVCSDNANCRLNPDLGIGPATASYLKNIYKGGQTNDDYWNDKWVDNSDICSWDGVTCDTDKQNNDYVSSVDIGSRYFKKPGQHNDICQYNNGTNVSQISQNEWVDLQRSNCRNLTSDDNCSDNTFCSWRDETPRCYNTDDSAGDGAPLDPNNFTKETCENANHVWKVGERTENGDTVSKGSCNLDDNYDVLSGWNDKDVFSDKTLNDILDKVNNGRVPDVNIFNNVTKDTRKDVVMSHDDQATAVKGIVEETALSRYFFSKENIEVLQQTIRYRVYQKTTEVIDYQSSRDLYIIMRSILLQHGNFKVSDNDLLTEIQLLNKRVEVYSVNEISSNVLQYKGYIKDIERLPVPIDRPGFNDSNSRNRSYDMSNHIAPLTTEGWQGTHNQLIN